MPAIARESDMVETDVNAAMEWAWKLKSEPSFLRVSSTLSERPPLSRTGYVTFEKLMITRLTKTVSGNEGLSVTKQT
ncbi:hypothetical protein KSX_37270 [Ktedonospora formicarum]|uniref:Uncharacterized protein n=1 Tax=Ktedonospora formicarum TaxID=2778364 RepID=A0A8J3I6F8_9CHLR|nr:hypothetical protein KSX_37270 [Ktedonospora formicarum]